MIWFKVINVRIVADDDIRVVVDSGALGRVKVNDEQFGFPETIRLVMNSFRRRMIWFKVVSVRTVADDDVQVVVDSGALGRVRVNDEQSGSPETIRLVMNNTKTRTI